MVRNNRVKTAAVEDSADMDDRDAFYDGASEADYLQHNRRAVKKNEQSRRFRIKTQAKWYDAYYLLGDLILKYSLADIAVLLLINQRW